MGAPATQSLSSFSASAADLPEMPAYPTAEGEGQYPIEFSYTSSRFGSQFLTTKSGDRYFVLIDRRWDLREEDPYVFVGPVYKYSDPHLLAGVNTGNGKATIYRLDYRIVPSTFNYNDPSVQKQWKEHCAAQGWEPGPVVPATSFYLPSLDPTVRQPNPRREETLAAAKTNWRNSMVLARQAGIHINHFRIRTGLVSAQKMSLVAAQFPQFYREALKNQGNETQFMSTGGATMAYTLRLLPESKTARVEIGMSVCSLKDRYNRRDGARRAINRLITGSKLNADSEKKSIFQEDKFLGYSKIEIPLTQEVWDKLNKQSSLASIPGSLHRELSLAILLLCMLGDPALKEADPPRHVSLVLSYVILSLMEEAAAYSQDSPGTDISSLMGILSLKTSQLEQAAPEVPTPN